MAVSLKIAVSLFLLWVVYYLDNLAAFTKPLSSPRVQ
jgi:hypothetical protein